MRASSQVVKLIGVVRSDRVFAVVDLGRYHAPRGGQKLEFCTKSAVFGEFW
jgi:hypothetical protein